MTKYIEVQEEATSIANDVKNPKYLFCY